MLSFPYDSNLSQRTAIFRTSTLWPLWFGVEPRGKEPTPMGSGVDPWKFTYALENGTTPPGIQASAGAIMGKNPAKGLSSRGLRGKGSQVRCSSVEEITTQAPCEPALECSSVEGFGPNGVVPWQTQKLALSPHKGYARLERILRPQYSYSAMQNAVQALRDGAVSWKNGVVGRNNRVGSWKSQCSCVEEPVKACGSFGVGSWKQVRLKAFKTNPVHNVKAFRELI